MGVTDPRLLELLVHHRLATDEELAYWRTGCPPEPADELEPELDTDAPRPPMDLTSLLYACLDAGMIDSHTLARLLAPTRRQRHRTDDDPWRHLTDGQRIEEAIRACASGAPAFSTIVELVEHIPSGRLLPPPPRPGPGAAPSRPKRWGRRKNLNTEGTPP